MKTRMLLLFLLVGGSIWAQEHSAVVEQAVADQTKHFQLTTAQVAQMYVIEERRERNLQEIEVLRESDYRLFLEKKRAVREHTEGTIRQILSKEQLQILYEDQRRYRVATSELIKQMRQEGKTKEEMELVILERG